MVDASLAAALPSSHDSAGISDDSRGTSNADPNADDDASVCLELSNVVSSGDVEMWLFITEPEPTSHVDRSVSRFGGVLAGKLLPTRTLPLLCRQGAPCWCSLRNTLRNERRCRLFFRRDVCAWFLAEA